MLQLFKYADTYSDTNVVVFIEVRYICIYLASSQPSSLVIKQKQPGPE